MSGLLRKRKIEALERKYMASVRNGQALTYEQVRKKYV